MRVKRTISCMLIMFLLIALIPAQVRAEEDTNRYSFGHFYYHSHNGYVSICGYLGRETEVEIPSVMSGRPVSEIESGSFQGCNTIETIIVPDTVVMVYEDSFTGAASLKKIISHTVGVEIKADSGVTIEYVNENNNQPTDETVPSEPANPSEGTETSSGTNPSEETTPAEPTNPSEETASSEPVNSPEETIPSNGNSGGSNEPGSTVPSDTHPGEEGTSGIGEGSYEEADTTPDEKTTEVPDIASDNTSDDTNTKQPEGIQIPDSDIVTTVNEDGNLIQKDAQGNEILLDDSKKYQMEQGADGSVIITDEDGNEVQVTDEGNVLFGELTEESNVLIGDMDEEEKVDNEAKKPIIIWVAVILGIAVVAVVAGFVVKKKMKKK